MLKFSFGNSKMNKLASYLGLRKNSVATFDLPAGYTCPMANLCQTYSNRLTGKITDGQNSKFRCYAANLESAFPSVRKLRWYNFDLLKSTGFNVQGMTQLIEVSLPKGIKVIRIHSSGDYFNENYFNAWVNVAKNHPEIKFFGYTKVLTYVNADKSPNFNLIYSYGGKMDNQVKNEPVAYVVNTVSDGHALGLTVSCQENPSDDYDYITAGKSFALALHGIQPKRSRGLTAEQGI